MLPRLTTLAACALAACFLTSESSAVSTYWTTYPTGPVYEGQTISLGASYSTSSNESAWVNSVSLNDGAGHTSNSYFSTFTYLDEGSYTASYSMSGNNYYRYQSTYWVTTGPYGQGYWYTSWNYSPTYYWAGSDSKTITVLNLAPTITSFLTPTDVIAGYLFNLSATATDPGINDVLTYSWDMNGDGIYGDLLGANQSYSFLDAGSYEIGLQVSDGDGGVTAGRYTIAVSSVPDAGSSAMLLGLAFAGIEGVRRRVRRG